MGDKTVSVRVRFEGGDQVKAGLQEVGREGTRALQSVGTVSRQTGAALQNAGYQVSDFFVQVQGGTAPTRALAQQLPQLLQGFGLVGVAASVLIAALPSLWSLFSSGASDAEALQKELEGISKAVDAYARASELALEPMDKLIKKYGAQAEAVRRARVEQAEQARADAMRSVSGLLKGLPDAGDTERFTSDQLAARVADRQQILDRLKSAEVEYRAAVQAGDQERMVALAAEERALKSQLATLSSIRQAVSETASAYGVTNEQAGQIAVLVERVRESAGQSAAEQVAAARALAEKLIEVYGSVDAANRATGGLVTALNGVVEEGARFVSIDMAGPIGAAVANATALADELARASLNWGKVANAGGVDAIARAGNLNNAVDIVGDNPNYDKRGDRSPARKGGGGGGADPDIARAKALTEAVRTETEKYAIALAEVNRLKQKGLITDETYNRQLDKLNDKLGETGDLAKKAASAIRSAFDGLFDDPARALKDLAKQLAMMALYSSLAKGFPSIFGSGGFLSLGVPAFAGGGRHKGGLRIVGENGPELEATGPSMIYPNDMLRSLGRSGGGTSVQVHNYGGGEVERRERRGPNGERQVDILVGKSLAGGRQDRALFSRFGQRPNAVKR